MAAAGFVLPSLSQLQGEGSSHLHINFWHIAAGKPIHEVLQLSHDLWKASLSPLLTPLPVPLISLAVALWPGQHQDQLLLLPLPLLAPRDLGVPS